MRTNRESKAQSLLDQFLGILERKHNVQLDKLERRLPYVVPPWWTPPFVYINESIKDAIKEHDTTEPGVIRIYTDGSGIDGHVGAAAATINLGYLNWGAGLPENGAPNPNTRTLCVTSSQWRRPYNVLFNCQH
ncbi:reverse transcriptase domain protein [Colletotrichum tofieldiae]|nr:reverse transcriptase domain protein [Colletotrichum tofieldiae]